MANGKYIDWPPFETDGNPVYRIPLPPDALPIVPERSGAPSAIVGLTIARFHRLRQRGDGGVLLYEFDGFEYK